LGEKNIVSTNEKAIGTHVDPPWVDNARSTHC